MKLLQPYLPTNGTSTSPYSEAGALYALGLIHANKGGVINNSGDDNNNTTTGGNNNNNDNNTSNNNSNNIIKYLTDALKNGGNSEVVQHGACLGLYFFFYLLKKICFKKYIYKICVQSFLLKNIKQIYF
jgi:26S proteasome regulatory subunit N2